VTGGFERASSLRRLADEHFDVLVVGGGITGAGVALDAASRGLRTALVERDDFASGTSSKSSKLVHGGLRYLQQKEFSLVHEALYERQRLLENAPHLVHVLPFLVPVMQRGGLIDRRVARVLGTALWMYDLAGGWRIGKWHHRISVDTARAHMPTLDPARLASAYLYYDAQADDARLTLAIARSAADHGAAVVNHTELVGLVKDGARVSGARVRAHDGNGSADDEIEVQARSVVNAAGVWADQVREIDEGADPASIRPAKGVHVTVPWSRVRNDIAAIIPVPNDRRSVFVVPWGDTTYVGTTDTDYRGPVDDPTCTGDDVDYLLGALNSVLTEPVARADVIGTWAGLRPLLRGGSPRTADLSRKHSVHASPSGVVTVTGGKLTTYRRMAADTVDAICEVVGVRAASRTKTLRLHGASGAPIPPEGGEEFGLGTVGMEASVREHLHGRYGSDAIAVARLVEKDPTLAAPLVEGQPYLRAEAVYAVREEMARTLDDVLSRRTRSRLFARDASADAAADTAALLAPELGWSDAERDRQIASYVASIVSERAAADS
jgi:glycerol-3-phosphate dehydrogenase